MKFKANILIITLFLLMMSSLSALLVTGYIKNLIKLSSSFHDYYKSYYVANAGLELALVKTNGDVRGYGFEDIVASGSSTVTSNFSGSSISFNTTIYTSSTGLGDANTSNPTSATACDASTLTGMGYVIPPGGCVPIILLEDNPTMTPSTYSGNEGYVQSITDSQLQPSKDVSSGYPSITIYGTTGFTSLVTLVDDNLAFVAGRSMGIGSSAATSGQPNILSITASGDTQLTSNGKYILMIANTTNTTGYYCAQSNVAISTQYVTINAQGTYRNTILDLKGVRRAGLPADFCYTAISS